MATCVGCDEEVRLDDQATDQWLWPGGCACKAHPLHTWCAGDSPVAPLVSRCSDCERPFERAALMAVCRWAAARFAALHDGTRAGARPPGIWCAQFAWRPMLIMSPRDEPGWFESLSIIERATVAQLPSSYLLYHDVCPGEDEVWPARIRAAPHDDDLKLVYADALEQAGQLERATFARDLVAFRRTGRPAARTAGTVPRWWRRLLSSR